MSVKMKIKIKKMEDGQYRIDDDSEKEKLYAVVTLLIDEYGNFMVVDCSFLGIWMENLAKHIKMTIGSGYPVILYAETVKALNDKWKEYKCIK